MAETHLEVYRRFDGSLREHPLRSWPICAAGLRTALKQRLALLILYGLLGIGTVIFSFFVYAGMAAQQRMEELPRAENFSEMLQQQAALAVARKGMEFLEVRRQLVAFVTAMGVFAILTTAWFGSGLFCEDRKAGAHQLYFARPITRLDYFLGKLGIAFFFALGAVLVPPLVICTIASLASEEWRFLKEEWDVPLRAIAFAAVWAGVVSLLVLAASSLASRRSFALVGAGALFMITMPLSAALGEILDERYFAIGIVFDLIAIAHHIFGLESPGEPSPPAMTAWAVIGGLALVSLLVIASRLRKLEVVA